MNSLYCTNVSVYFIIKDNIVIVAKVWYVTLNVSEIENHYSIFTGGPLKYFFTAAFVLSMIHNALESSSWI